MKKLPFEGKRTLTLGRFYGWCRDTQRMRETNLHLTAALLRPVITTAAEAKVLKVMIIMVLVVSLVSSNWDWIYGIAFTTSVGQPGAFSKRLGIKLRTGVFEFPITPTLFYGPSPASQYRPQNYHEIRLNCQFSLGLELSCAESNEHHSWSKKWFRYFRITATWTTSAAKAKGVKDLVSLIDLLLVSMDLLGLKQRVCDWNRYLS